MENTYQVTDSLLLRLEDVTFDALLALRAEHLDGGTEDPSRFGGGDEETRSAQLVGLVGQQALQVGRAGLGDADVQEQRTAGSSAGRPEPVHT